MGHKSTVSSTETGLRRRNDFTESDRESPRKKKTKTCCNFNWRPLGGQRSTLSQSDVGTQTSLEDVVPASSSGEDSSRISGDGGTSRHIRITLAEHSNTDSDSEVDIIPPTPPQKRETGKNFRNKNRCVPAPPHPVRKAVVHTSNVKTATSKASVPTPTANKGQSTAAPRYKKDTSEVEAVRYAISHIEAVLNSVDSISPFSPPQELAPENRPSLSTTANTENVSPINPNVTLRPRLQTPRYEPLTTTTSGKSHPQPFTTLVKLPPKLEIPDLIFQRLVLEIFEDKHPGFGIQWGAIRTLHEAGEGCIIACFEDLSLCSLHADRLTVMENDFILRRKLIEGGTQPFSVVLPNDNFQNGDKNRLAENKDDDSGVGNQSSAEDEDDDEEEDY